jgi:HD-GYP domain-containing protein (c-di-GMP phosphodiesterase class II)
VPDAVLQKPGPLSTAERLTMQQHPVIGEEIVRPLHSAEPLLAIIRHHHEWVDGSGYPDRLAGDRIPLLARIVGVCDAYDALTSDRPYRPGRSAGEAIAVLGQGAGTQWDIGLVRLFTDSVVDPKRGLQAHVPDLLRRFDQRLIQSLPAHSA